MIVMLTAEEHIHGPAMVFHAQLPAKLSSLSPGLKKSTCLNYCRRLCKIWRLNYSNYLPFDV